MAVARLSAFSAILQDRVFDLDSVDEDLRLATQTGSVLVSVPVEVPKTIKDVSVTELFCESGFDAVPQYVQS